jgi:hypothetical protein
MVWWLWQARGADFRTTWTLFSPFNIGSVLIQWGIVLALLLAANGWLARRIEAHLERRTDLRAGEPPLDPARSFERSP